MSPPIKLVNEVRPYLLQIGLLTVLWTAFSMTTPLFTGISSVYAVVEGFAVLGLISVGLLVPVLAGELDLSVAAMAALAGGIAVRNADLGLAAALALATLVGMAVGAIQGGLISRLGISSVVFTVGTMLALSGASFLVSDNAAMPLEDFSVSDPLLVRWEFLSPNSLIAIIVFVLVGSFLTSTKFGREVYAIGGGPREAAAAGVSKMRVMVLSFAICGGCAALAGALASIKSGSSTPGGYSDLLLIAPAAILVGGINLDGGRGTVINVVLGVAIISVVRSGLGFRGVESYIVDLTIGSLLLVFVVADFFIQTASEQRVRDRTAKRVLANG